MGKRILIVAEAEGIVVRGLETKLAGLGMEAVFSPLKVSSLKDALTRTALVILFVEDEAAKLADSLVLIKDYCVENDSYIIVVADQDHYNITTNIIGTSHILNNYSRPIDTERFLSQVEDYMSKVSSMERRQSILIVDDDVSYMSMIMLWLKDKYRVSLANSGMEAITWLAGNTPDLILLDYEMPITPGPQVLQMIRSSVKTADIPVMFLTGKGDKESIMSVLELKPAGYLLKTIDKDGLIKALKEFFARQKTEKILS
ncbi:MAG: response regulator [Lachnospiraceae bacterium]|nr:response regulator [Lachnospiraceae bacterium]